MTSDTSDTAIRAKLRSGSAAVREKGLEALIAKYRDPICGYLSRRLKQLHFYRLLSEVPVIWSETTVIVWRKAGPDGAIRAEGDLRTYLQGIAHNIAKSRSRKSARRHGRIDDSVQIADLEPPDATRYDERHDLCEVLEHRFKRLTRTEIWLLEIESGLCLPNGELEVEIEENCKLSKMEAVTHWYNQRLDEHYQTMDGSDEKETHIDVRRAKTILDRVHRKLHRIAEMKGGF